MKLDTVIAFGSLAGWISLFWLLVRELMKWRRRPRLRIHDLDLEKDIRIWDFYEPQCRRKLFSLDIENKGKETAKCCVATLIFHPTPKGVPCPRERYKLHWAGVDYTAQTGGAEPVDIGPELHRVDVIFSQEGNPNPGAWVAIPLALAMPDRHKAYLRPGAYEIELKVACENGKGDRQRYIVRSPKLWENLTVDKKP